MPSNDGGSPALQIEDDPGGEWLANRMIVIARFAEELDRETLAVALRIVRLTGGGSVWAQPPLVPRTRLRDDLVGNR